MTQATNNALIRLAHAESTFMSSELLAPVVSGTGVMLGIDNVRCAFRVLPADYRGWGIFHPVSHNCARAVRVASMDERRRYLDLCPSIQLIVIARSPDAIMAIPANTADRRFGISGTVTVNLAFAGDFFDTILARFDGRQFWFDQIDARGNGMAAFLRRQLAMRTIPDRVARSGMTQAHRTAYGMIFGGKRFRAARNPV